jgi:hypothetical protein
MNVLVFVEVDVVVRHFLHSGAFDALGKSSNLTFVFPEIGNKRMGDVDPTKLQLPGPFIHLQVHDERRRLWKRLFQVSLFRFSFGTQAGAIRRLYASALGWKASFQFTILSCPGIFFFFNCFTRYRLKKNPYLELQALINQERPNVIIHPCVMEGSFLNDLIDLCKARRIPLVVIMNSWDNPSTKRAMIGNPDWLLVWGSQTQNHGIKFAKMPTDRVVKFGAAQFDIYRMPARIGRLEFCSINSIDPGCKLLLYAGSSKGTDEIAHLSELDQAIEEGVLGNTVVLYRPHPWGGGGRNGHLLVDKVWRNVYIESSMQNYLERVHTGFSGKYLSDYRDTHDILSCVDAVISPLSTIILEAALHGRPVMCFLPFEDASEHFMRDFALTHFHQLFDIPEIFISNGNLELIDKTVLLLKQIGNEQYSTRLRDSMSYFVEPFDRPYSTRLQEFIHNLG